MSENTITVNAKVLGFGDQTFDDGTEVRGVMLEMHSDDLRKLAPLGVLFADVKVTIEKQDPK